MNPGHRNVTVGDLFTEDELLRAKAIIDNHRKTSLSNIALIDRLQEEIEAILPRINASTGQDNDPRYLAYMLEHILRNGGVR